MKKIITLLVASILLVGCGMFPTRIEYVEKKVPIAVVPAPPVVPAPDYDLDDLTDEQRLLIGVVAKAYAIDLSMCMSYAGILEEIVDTYRELSENNPPDGFLAFGSELTFSPLFPLSNEEKASRAERAAQAYEKAKRRLEAINKKILERYAIYEK